MTFLGGPGIWTYRPVVEAVVDIGALEDHPPTPCPASTTA
jgi:cyanophycin synthetase